MVLSSAWKKTGKPVVLSHHTAGPRDISVKTRRLSPGDSCKDLRLFKRGTGRIQLCLVLTTTDTAASVFRQLSTVKGFSPLRAFSKGEGKGKRSRFRTLQSSPQDGGDLLSLLGKGQFTPEVPTLMTATLQIMTSYDLACQAGGKRPIFWILLSCKTHEVLEACKEISWSRILNPGALEKASLKHLDQRWLGSSRGQGRWKQWRGAGVARGEEQQVDP